jgi:hypothetical protein
MKKQRVTSRLKFRIAGIETTRACTEAYKFLFLEITFRGLKSLAILMILTEGMLSEVREIKALTAITKSTLFQSFFQKLVSPLK